ncbi:unnamed protein product, partial [Clonostachys rhizophaga]
HYAPWRSDSHKPCPRPSELSPINSNFSQFRNPVTCRHSSTTKNATRAIVSHMLRSIGSNLAVLIKAPRNERRALLKTRVPIRPLTYKWQKREAQLYLQLFASTQTFCVLKVGDAILSEHLDELGLQLAFLYELGLLPILVHRGGPQLDSRLARESNPCIFGGHTRHCPQENLKLTDKLDQLGVSNRLSVASLWQTISTRRIRATLAK